MNALKKPQLRFGLLVLVPILAWYLLFSFRPVFMGLRMAVIEYKLLDPANSPYIGLRNFEILFTTHQLFWTAVKNTLAYAIGINLATLPMALGLACCVVGVRRGRGLYQWALFVPVVLSMPAIALMFRFLMDPSGVLNHLLALVGLPTSKWLVGAKSALPTVAAVALWKGLGGNIVLLTAGLIGIPLEMYDAAEVDGASSWQTFWKVTLPLLGPTLKLVMILVTIGSLQAYTSVFILTGGGPAHKTFLINQFILGEAFTNMNFGLASAAASMLFVAILVVTLAQLRLTRVKWEY